MPPAEAKPEEVAGAPWRTEHDVVTSLKALGHEVHALGVGSELNPIRRAVREVRPHLSFNLLEGFDDVAAVGPERGRLPRAAEDEVQRMQRARPPARARQGAGEEAAVVSPHSGGRSSLSRRVAALFRRPRYLAFPLIVKSLSFDASIGISQASVVETEEKLEERVAFHPREHRHRCARGELHRRPRAVCGRTRQSPPEGVADLGAVVRQHAGSGAQDRHRAPEVEPHLSAEARHRERSGARAARWSGGADPETVQARLYRALPLRLRADRPAPHRRGRGVRHRSQSESADRARRGFCQRRPRRRASTTARSCSASSTSASTGSRLRLSSWSDSC